MIKTENSGIFPKRFVELMGSRERKLVKGERKTTAINSLQVSENVQTIVITSALASVLFE